MKKITNIKKGLRFFWTLDHVSDYSGWYEVICYTKDLSLIFAYKPSGKKATIKQDGDLAKFDKRIINNEDFTIL